MDNHSLIVHLIIQSLESSLMLISKNKFSSHLILKFTHQSLKKNV